MIRTLKLVLIGLLTLGLLTLAISTTKPEEKHATLGSGFGSLETLVAHYNEWETEYVRNGGERNVTLPVGCFKGLSTEQTGAQGLVTLNLIDGIVSAKITGLSKDQAWDLWLIENGAGSGVLPEPEDRQINVGTLRPDGDAVKIESQLGAGAFDYFMPDLVIVTRAGLKPAENRVLAGMTSLFQRLYGSKQRGDLGSKYKFRSEESTSQANGLISGFLAFFAPTAQATADQDRGASTALDQLITEGRRIFLDETFGGNGRTCATCHREENNFTIDPNFIATLPPTDPLFVGETNPNLGARFENPRLLREFGLVLENVDGFEDLDNKFVMRGVPTILGVSTSLRATALDGTTMPPNERLGYSGDGAPGTGTLREFAIGAIIQHFTKSLGRVPGQDFRLPTDNELDALEAFQRSLGRQADLNVAAMSFKSVVVTRGRDIFNNPTLGKCIFCHANGGANIASGPLAGVNPNFNIGVQNLPDQPANLTGERNPLDGGFGRTPGPGGFGNGTFNSLALVEAADTGPYFHNNSVATLEGAVEFYNSLAFNNSPIPPGLRGIHLETTQVMAVAAFLRVLNSLENIRSSIDLLERAKAESRTDPARELLNLAMHELGDAIEVLEAASLHPEAQVKLAQALVPVRTAFEAGRGNSHVQRRRLIDEALPSIIAARGDMIN